MPSSLSDTMEDRRTLTADAPVKAPDPLQAESVQPARPDSAQADGRPADAPDGAEYQYLELCWTAVSSLAAGVLALISVPLAFISNPEPSSVLLFGVLPAIALVAGLRAIFLIRSRPDELTGVRFAWVGMLLAMISAAGGWSAMGYVYATEVPPDYQRVVYDQLAPPGSALAPGMFFEVPASAVELDGKQVFIKGYAYPGDQKTGIRQFILCRDNGDCCFGGTPKMSDMIFVRLKEPQAIDYTTRIHKLAGTFRVAAGAALHNLGGVVYHLDNAECR